MAQCIHTIDYGNGRTAHCALSEHTHVLHEWVKDEIVSVPSLPDADDTDMGGIDSDFFNNI